MQNLSLSDPWLPLPIFNEYEYWYWPGNFSQGGDGTWSNGRTGKVNISQFLQSVYNETKPPVDPLQVRTSWIDLPDSFGSTSTGLALLYSYGNSSSSGYKLGMGCSIDARWAAGVNWLTASNGDWTWAGYSQPTKSTILNTRKASNGWGGSRLFRPTDSGGWRRIAMSEEWKAALTPVVADKNSTTLGAILKQSSPNIVHVETIDGNFSNTSMALTPFVEHVVSSYITDGLSRVGPNLQANGVAIKKLFGGIEAEQFSLGSPKVVVRPTTNGADQTKMITHTEVQGYAYVLFGGTSYFAVTVIMLHIILSLAHLVILWILGRPSARWETVSELVILAQGAMSRDLGAEKHQTGFWRKSIFTQEVEMPETGDRINIRDRINRGNDS